LIYRGPFAAALTEEGELIERGQVAELPWREGMALAEEVFLLDEGGSVTNVEQEMTCACFVTPEQGAEPIVSTRPRNRTDCMVCGAPLTYPERECPELCHYCGQEKLANAVCAEGHFVCDACHSQDALKVMRHLLLQSEERDMVALLKRIRRHVALPIHGPEHHSLVPGIIVAAYRNSGGRASEAQIDSALRRGSTIAGGACAFFGVCGAATGVGTGFSILLGATPHKARERQLLQLAAADEPLLCEQFQSNKECLGRGCPLWPSRAG